MAATLGTGTTITFGTSSWTAVLLDVDGPGLTREKVKSTTMETTGFHTYIPGDLVDPGELEIELECDGTNGPPISSAAETITIKWSGDTASVSSATGFMTAYKPSAPLEERMTATATIAFSGSITV